jgi:hypothetical protein
VCHFGRVSGQERERDRAIQGGEQADRPGPEPLQLGAELVGQRNPRGDQILPRAGQRSQRLGLIRIRFQDPEAMRVGTGELAQHEAVTPVGLPARGAEPIPCGLDLVGMQRQHAQPGLEQPLDC